jgi:hypothetical protein
LISVLQELKDFSRLLPQVNESNFEEIALQLFNLQYKNNLLYQTYADYLGRGADRVKSLIDIPYLPISFFKSHPVKTGRWDAETEFSSSGTTGAITSRHAVPDLDFYLKHSVACFEYFFGPLRDYHFLALLPSYLERSGSSLVAMMDHFIKQDETGQSGFYLKNEDELLAQVAKLKSSGKKTMLWGVSFALMDLAERKDVDLSHCLVMETGGMKGRRREVTREELHSFLCEGLKTSGICSEYGMTELMSQAYALEGGYFRCPPWMKVVLRDINDPLEQAPAGRAGAINVIDLANLYSCSFIETEDLGRLSERGFEVLGRMDNSDIRGCNLLIA